MRLLVAAVLAANLLSSPIVVAQTTNPSQKASADFQPPVVLVRPDPAYPNSAMSSSGSVVVLVSLVVDKHGLPMKAHVKQSGGVAFDEAAIATVRKYRFQPATRNGLPVAADLVVEIKFETKQ